MRTLAIVYELNGEDYDLFFAHLHKSDAVPLQTHMWGIERTNHTCSELHEQLSHLLSPRDHLFVTEVKALPSARSFEENVKYSNARSAECDKLSAHDRSLR
jgi:hypothetical protein